MVAGLIAGCCSCNLPGSNNTAKAVKDSAIGMIEIYDSSANAAINSNATITVIGRNFNWAEGPLWIEDEQVLLFSDVPENKIFRWKAGDTTAVYLTPAGYTGVAPRKGEIGSNGLALDTAGRLLICQSGNRQVVIMNAPVSAPKADFTALAANYKGKKFNSPNDLVADSKNNIYFTDPVYGLPDGEQDATRELNVEGVYKISTDGTIRLLIDSIKKPNGIALSPDEKKLYVASSDDKHPRWLVYNLDEKGNIVNGSVLLDATGMKQKATVKQGADGFKIDKWGNIFSAGPDGINIISPAGELIGLIKIYNRRASNCSFNKAKDVVYVTADDLVLKVDLHPKKQ